MSHAAWDGPVSREVRDGVALLTAAPRRAPVLRFLVMAAMFAALGLVMVRSDHLVLRVAAAIGLGILLCTLDVVQHEATHRFLSSSQLANRVVGVVVSALLARNFSQYVAFHFAHHAHTCTDEDPEGDHVVTSRAQLATISARTVRFWWWQWRDLGRVVLGTRPVPYVRTRRQVHDVRVDAAWLLDIYASFVAASLLLDPWIVLWWAGPVAAYVVVGFPFFHLHEHYGFDVQPDWAPRRPQAVVTRTMGVTHPVSWLLGHGNLHTAHHMFPAVPSQQLPTLHRLLVEHDPDLAVVEPGLMRFLGGVWRDLPTSTPSRETEVAG